MGLEAARKAAQQYAESRQTRSEKCAKAAASEPMLESPMIGGGAALVALQDGQYLIDGRGRWQSDSGSRIAQTTRALMDHSCLVNVGFQPYATNDERVPTAALAAWQDSRPKLVINGTAELLWSDSGLALRISGEFNAEVQVTGQPVVATGLPASVPNKEWADDWSTWKNEHPTCFLLGDEACHQSNAPMIRLHRHWAVIGSLGTALSAAESILLLNEEARVVLFSEARKLEELRKAPQWAEIVANERFIHRDARGKLRCRSGIFVNDQLFDGVVDATRRAVGRHPDALVGLLQEAKNATVHIGQLRHTASYCVELDAGGPFVHVLGAAAFHPHLEALCSGADLLKLQDEVSRARSSLDTDYGPSHMYPSYRVVADLCSEWRPKDDDIPEGVGA